MKAKKKITLDDRHALKKTRPKGLYDEERKEEEREKEEKEGRRRKKPLEIRSDVAKTTAR